MFKNPPTQQTPTLDPRFARRRTRSLIAMLSVASSLATSAALADAPYLRAPTPITDSQGRVQVIIDFKDDAHLRYPGIVPAPLTVQEAALGKTLKFIQKPQTNALIAEYEATYNISRVRMTSWVGNSMTAFAAPSTIKRLLLDARVKQVSDDYYVEQSSPTPPTWYPISGDVESGWNQVAVNAKTYNNNTNTLRKIYIIDAGVALHADLPTMIRLNVACNGGANCNSTDYPLVGCYGHATHVAGIVGAIANSGNGVKGIYGGFPNMVSLAVTERSAANTANCGDVIAASGVANSLDYVYWDATQNNPYKIAHIATMSINTGGAQYVTENAPGANWNRIKTVATTIWANGIPLIPGVFFVQSSGNVNPVSSQTDACFRAYRPDFGLPAAVEDGVMVVGAVHHNGHAVVLSELFSGTYPSDPPLAGSEYYSTGGPCVDVWAPGNLVPSLWGEHVAANDHFTVWPTQYTGVLLSGNQGWAFLSGTSMAAPHVAAAAAWLADSQGLTSSSAIETAVRANSYQFNGNLDSFGLPVNMIQLP